jgi:hypothetical protein
MTNTNYEYNIEIIKKFIDYILSKKRIKTLKKELELEQNCTTFNNFITLLLKYIEKKEILNKLKLNILSKPLQINFLNDNHYPLIKVFFFYDEKINKINCSLYEKNIINKLLDNFINIKYLKFNYVIKKQLQNSLITKNTQWKKLILNGRIYSYRYTPQTMITY